MSQDSMSLISVLWTIRDSRYVRNAERQLLDALAMRCNPKKGYRCWPSYAQLSLDTGCSIATLKKAAAGLEQKQIIKRYVRHNRANVYAINIAKLVELADVQRAADRAKREALGEDEFAAFNNPSISEEVYESEEAPETEEWMPEVAR
jgi:hypothetical protein